MLLSPVGGLSLVLLLAAVLLVLLAALAVATVVGAWRRYVGSDGGEDDGERHHPQDL